jgi:hypothetical protein
VSRWQIVKDVLLTGTGILLVLSQVWAARPSDVILVTGLALTVPSVAGHTAALLSGHGGGQSSPPPPPLQSSQPSSQPAGGTGE